MRDNQPTQPTGESPWQDSGPEAQDRPARGRVRRTAGCLVPLVAVAAVGYGGYLAYDQVESYFSGQTCRLVVGDQTETWEPEQAANASTITTVGVTLDHLPVQAAHIAVTTAIQESKLRNLNYGDRDSLGLFQQRPSQGWGTAEQIVDPIYASRAFYEHLVTVKNWQQRPLTEVAQAVQRSGYPEAYADHEGQGRVLSQVLSGQQPAAVGCRLDAATTAAPPAQLASKLRAQTGVRATTSGSTLSVRAGSTTTAWAVAGWAVTHAEADGVTRVTVGNQQWQRQRDKGGWSWTSADRPTGAPTAVRIELA